MADGNFINGIKIACGLLVTALFGSCTALFLPEVFAQILRGDANSFGISIVLFLGIIPTIGGIALIIWGIMGIRANRARKASRNDSPNHRGRARDRTDDHD